ncbi:MAG: hypothetical protein IKX65_02200 [Prevotella sp.]|nr:hypothetical protein [Prevotella sp.]
MIITIEKKLLYYNIKKSFYFALLTLMLVACGQSKEQKAETLIKESLKKYLYKPETYKPVDTKVDSAFAPYDDPAFFEALAKLESINSEYEDLNEEAKREKSAMAIWSGPYQSLFGKEEYQQAKEKYDDANAKMEKLISQRKKLSDKIETILKAERRFIGYKAIHNYRADNNAGNTLIGNTIFFFDESFKEVTYYMDVEDYNQVQEAIGEYKEQIEEIKK